jgi:penicillin-binding protein 1A
MVRIFLKALAIAFGGCVLAVGLALGWFFFYSRDLPDVHLLDRLLPQSATSVSAPRASNISIAIPYDSIGSNLRAALNSAEGGEGPTAIGQVLHGFSDVRDERSALSFQIARSMFCEPEKHLTRDLGELRLAAQLDRHFSQRELFTIAANRYYSGEGGVGIQAASQFYFHKNPSELSIGDAALLAGLVRAPSYFSPEKHPDRALRRRNDVLDAMVKEGRITAAEGDAASRSSLQLAAEVGRVDSPSSHGDCRRPK